MTHKGWWYRASHEQRLRQIDAGIELGMTAKQVAMVSGGRYGEGRGTTSVVAVFASRNGRAFPNAERSWAGTKSANLRRASSRARDAYFSGQSTDDLWRDDPRQAVAAELEEIILE